MIQCHVDHDIVRLRFLPAPAPLNTSKTPLSESTTFTEHVMPVEQYKQLTNEVEKQARVNLLNMLAVEIAAEGPIFESQACNFLRRIQFKLKKEGKI